MINIKMSRGQKIAVGLLCLGVMLLPSCYLVHLGFTENLGSQTIDPGTGIDWGHVLFLFLFPLFTAGIPLSVLALAICLLVAYVTNRVRNR